MASSASASRALVGRSYTASGRDVTVTGGFQRLWHDALLFDTELLVEGESFHVHRAFLAACSEYFYTMFTSNFQEKSQNKVEMKGLTSMGLRTLLDYAYTGTIVLNHRNLPDVLQAADQLQFTEVLQMCSNYLRDEMNAGNCVQLLSIADPYSVNDFKRDAESFILQNFMQVARTDDFATVSQDLLHRLLSDDELLADSEIDVFRIAVTWLEGGHSSDSPSTVKEILADIRYGLMRADQIDYICGNRLLLTDPCSDVLQSALRYHMHVFHQALDTPPMSRMRAQRDCIVIFGGGLLDSTLSSNVLAAPADNAQLGPFSTLNPTEYPRYFASVASVNGFVFVIGGQLAVAGDGSQSTASGFRYNGRNGTWQQIARMTRPRTHFVVIPMGAFLIAVGGSDGGVPLRTAERYDIAANEWSRIAGLRSPLFSHAGCSMSNRAYISGGYEGNGLTNDLRCYNMGDEEWTLKTPMSATRGCHVMVGHDGCLFVCGGLTMGVEYQDLMRTECYDVALGQWTILAPSLKGQSQAPAVKIGSHIFIVGGYNCEEDTFLDTVQAYNLRTDTWEVSPRKLPHAMTGVIASNVALSQHFFQ